MCADRCGGPRAPALGSRAEGAAPRVSKSKGKPKSGGPRDVSGKASSRQRQRRCPILGGVPSVPWESPSTSRASRTDNTRPALHRAGARPPGSPASPLLLGFRGHDPRPPTAKGRLLPALTGPEGVRSRLPNLAPLSSDGRFGRLGQLQTRGRGPVTPGGGGGLGAHLTVGAESGGDGGLYVNRGCAPAP